MKYNYPRFNQSNFKRICRELAARDADLGNIITRHGYPPMWTRPAHFQTLILTILEQQVSKEISQLAN